MTAQHLVALTIAQRRRLAAATVRKEVVAGNMTVTEALNDDRAGSLTVSRLLMAQPRWGPTHLRKHLQACRDEGCRVRENMYVRELTDRQRAMLIRCLRSSPQTDRIPRQ